MANSSKLLTIDAGSFDFPFGWPGDAASLVAKTGFSPAVPASYPVPNRDAFVPAKCRKKASPKGHRKRVDRKWIDRKRIDRKRIDWKRVEWKRVERNRVERKRVDRKRVERKRPSGRWWRMRELIRRPWSPKVELPPSCPNEILVDAAVEPPFPPSQSSLALRSARPFPQFLELKGAGGRARKVQVQMEGRKGEKGNIIYDIFKLNRTAVCREK